jgi:hypothetical protein
MSSKNTCRIRRYSRSIGSLNDTPKYVISDVEWDIVMINHAVVSHSSFNIDAYVLVRSVDFNCCSGNLMRSVAQLRLDGREMSTRYQDLDSGFSEPVDIWEEFVDGMELI